MSLTKEECKKVSKVIGVDKKYTTVQDMLDKSIKEHKKANGFGGFQGVNFLRLIPYLKKLKKKDRGK